MPLAFYGDFLLFRHSIVCFIVQLELRALCEILLTRSVFVNCVLFNPLLHIFTLWTVAFPVKFIPFARPWCPDHYFVEATPNAHSMATKHECMVGFRENGFGSLHKIMSPIPSIESVLNGTYYKSLHQICRILEPEEL